jgi:hypothetical protein
MTVDSLDHVLLWAPITVIHRLAPTPLLMVTGVEDSVHAIDEVLKAYERAWEPKRLDLLPVDEVGLSIEPGLSVDEPGCRLLRPAPSQGGAVRAVADRRPGPRSRPMPRILIGGAVSAHRDGQRHPAAAEAVPAARDSR